MTQSQSDQQLTNRVRRGTCPTGRETLKTASGAGLRERIAWDLESGGAVESWVAGTRIPKMEYSGSGYYPDTP